MSKEFFNSRDNPLKAMATVDEQSPIGQKWLELGGTDGLGDPLDTAQPFSDQVGSYQQFANGAIFSSTAYGAVVVSSAIFAKWASSSVTNAVTYCGDLVQDYLGYPTDDFFPTAEGGYAAYFERGTIIVRWNDRAYVVYEAIYGHYRELGDVRGALHLPEVGLPESDEEIASGGGRRSRFERGDIYWHPTTGAREVHGAIREHWLELGGAASFLGYPTSDEMSVTRGLSEIGRSQRFQNGAVMYWSPETGAWEVHGDIRRALDERFGGVTGGLGFPVSDEKDTPAFTGCFNNFQNGVIAWLGDIDHTYQVLGLELYLERFTTSDSFNVQIDIQATDSQMHQINRGRMPASGDYDGSSAALMTVDRVQGDLVWTIWMEAIHEVTLGTDDRMGTIQKSYSIDDNLWGMLDTSSTHSSTGSFVARYRFRPSQTVVDLDPKKFLGQLFWPFNNFSTTKLNWDQYAQTFQDINQNDRKKPWHPFEIVFYEAVYNAIAENGNCFGMSLESIYARVGKSLFEEPINTSPFNSYRHDGQKLDPNAPHDGEAINEINIKQGYQVGVGLLNWFLGEVIAGHLHNPLRAYHESKAAYERGDFPILSLSEKSKFSQHGHAVVPFYWDDFTNPDGPWLIHVASTNNAVAAPGSDLADEVAFAGTPSNLIYVYPGDNTFKFFMDSTWTGGEEDGGRMWSIPFSRLNSRPSTPGWEILALLAGAVLIVLAGDGETKQITDAGGATFYEYLDVPASSTTMMIPGLSPRKRINENTSTHIAEMARVPFHHQHPKSAGEGLVKENPRVETELYYLQRNPFPPCWEQGTRTDQSTRPVFGPNDTMASPHEGAPRISTSRSRRGEEAMETAFARSLLETTLTHEVIAPQGGQYRWAIRAPRMSASISAPGTGSIADTIIVSQVGLADQAVSLLVAAKSEAKQVTIAVAGWSGNKADQARWFELNNMMMESNHAVTVQVKNGGQELLLQNSGPLVTFELQVHAGLSNQAARSKVTLEAGKSARIRPTSWSPETIATGSVLMDVMDKLDGPVVRQITL